MEVVVFGPGASEVAGVVVAGPVGWLADPDGGVQVPATAHGEHEYHGLCALCRCGDQRAAFEAVVARVLEVFEAESIPVEAQLDGLARANTRLLMQRDVLARALFDAGVELPKFL